jgi:hypothetical protein
MKTTKNFTIKSLGKKEVTVYDIETNNNHNFFCNGKDTEERVLVHNSNYLTLEKVVEKLGLVFKDNKEFADWIKAFIDDTLQPLIDKTLEDYAFEYGLSNIIKFKREKIIKDMFVVAGKNYALSVIEDEKGKTWYDKPSVKITGIPVKKKTAQKIAQTHLPEILNDIMTGKDKNIIKEKLAVVKEVYLTEDATFEEVFILGSLTTYNKYLISNEFIKENGFKFKSRTSPKARGALLHNYILEELGIDTVFPITEGMMCKTCYVLPNKYGVDAISWEDKFPSEFEGLFQIDKVTMFEKAIMTMLDKWATIAYGSLINLDTDGAIDDFFGY